MDPWAEMDAWLVRQNEPVKDRVCELIYQGVSVNDPEVRNLVGQGQAIARMRSYIHGARRAAENPNG